MISISAERPPQAYARTAGVLYLIIIAAGIFAEAFVRGPLVVSGDAAATAANILESEQLFRNAFAGEILLLCCDVALALIFYVMLKPIDANLALLTAFFRLVMAAVSGVNALNHYEALILLSGADYLAAFSDAQLHAMALFSFAKHSKGYDIALVFFGFYCLILGYLIFRSGYLPRLIGGLLIVASFGYLANSFAAFLAPEIGRMLFPWSLLPALVAELSLALWLLIMGVNARRWREAVERGGP